jgi:phycoerythrin-associated linker protein
MDIIQFVEQSIGQWRSQRSAHHLAFSHFEAVQSIIDIDMLSSEDPAVVELCRAYDVDPSKAVSPFQMNWEGQSDWDEDSPEVKGSAILIPIPDPSTPQRGKLLRDRGYAETIAAAGEYHFLDDGTFVLITAYERAAAEERIWFANPNLRFRVSLIKTSAGSGVVTASFSSEIRSSKPQ